MYPVPKPSFKRRKKKRRNLTRITKKVSDEVISRSGGLCERCGSKHPKAWGVQRAHLINASQLGRGDEPWNVAILCGPSTQTGTCHWFVDSTKEGRRWKQQYRDELKAKYESGELPWQ